MTEKKETEKIVNAIDSHCHLDYFEDLDDVVARARAAGVNKVVTIGTKSGDASQLEAICDRFHDFARMTVGVHPDEVQGMKSADFDRLFENRGRFVVGVGEIGLDYRDHPDNFVKAQQRQAFGEQMARAGDQHLPVVIHTRQAFDETVDVVRGCHGVRGIFHCFCEGIDAARVALDLGFLISFSGIVTFKKSVSLQDVARFVPLDRILIETDAPYLSPEPLRGKRNEPAHVCLTGRFIAQLKAVAPDDVFRVTRTNAYQVFGEW